MPLAFDRVAQLTVPLTSGKTRIGSGFLLAPRLVLTAAHVVEDAGRPAQRLTVRFPAAGGGAVSGSPVWSGTAVGLDAALLRLDTAPAGGLSRRALRWGRLTGQQPGEPATAGGFSRALGEDDGQRIPDQPAGTVNPGVAFGDRYDLILDGAHPLAQATDPSPWSGLSGAALFSGELLIGVLVLDTPNFSSGRLTGVPVWRLLADPGFTRILTEHGCSTGWESVELADLFARSEGGLDSPAALLRADTAVVRFRGRATELAQLSDWYTTDRAAALALLTGPGGQGKTRLARQLCQQLRDADWLAGLVAPSAAATAAAARVPDSRLPVLLVIDYAETRAEQVRQIAEAAADPGSSVRLLLLPGAGGDGGDELRTALPRRFGAALRLALPALEDTGEGRTQAYRDAVADLARVLPQLPDRAGTDWAELVDRLVAPDLSAAAFGSVLTLQLRALTDLLTLATTGQATAHRVEELEDVLLDHEQGYWRQTAAREGLVKPAFQPPTLDRAVGVATLCGAATEDDALATVARIPGLADKEQQALSGVARWLADLYPSSEFRFWGPLQPDRVGEHLVGRVTRDRPTLLAEVLPGTAADQRLLALTVLARAVGSQPHLGGPLHDLLTQHLHEFGPPAVQAALQAADPQPLLAALGDAGLAATDPAQLTPVLDALPEHSTRLAATAATLTAHLVTLYRELAEAAPDAYLPDLASSLNNYSVRLDAVGRSAEA